MKRWAVAAAFTVLLACTASAQQPADPARVWEINGIRLEPAQVERLADDMAARTVAAVQTKVESIDLRDGQAEEMRAVYRGVALEVFADVVKEVERSDQTDAQKEERVRELVLEGQKRSHAKLETVLDARQLALYTAWEEKQVDAFKSRRWNDRRRRR